MAYCNAQIGKHQAGNGLSEGGQESDQQMVAAPKEEVTIQNTFAFEKKSFSFINQSIDDSVEIRLVWSKTRGVTRKTR